MKRFKLVLVLALVFVAGAAVGVVGTRIVVRRIVREAMAHPEKVQAIIERNLGRRLRLDNEQQIKLNKILSETQGDLRDLQQEFRPRLATVLVQTDDQISSILTPDQKARYENLKRHEIPVLQELRKTN